MAKKRKSEPQEQPEPEPETQNDQNTLEPQPEPEPEQFEDIEDDVEYEDEENEGVEEEEEVKVNGGDGEGGEEGDDEPIEKLLEPFNKDHLLILLKEAVIKYPDFVENVKKLADLDPVHRKIFVYGLGWDTTSESLISEFGKFGEIEDCKAVMDKVTGKCKGYAFVLFKKRIGVKKALEEPQKTIGGRVVSWQLASAGPVNVAAAGGGAGASVAPVSEHTQRKIFVSNVGADVDVGKLVEFFARFGEIEEGPLGLDKQTGKPRGFCLFVYKSVEGAKKALEEPHKTFEGHLLNCQKAVDGPKAGKGGGVGGFFQQQPYHGQHHHSQQSHYGHTAKKAKYSGGSGSGGTAPYGGHLMAPAAGNAAVGFNPGLSASAIGQALALIASQGAGLGFGNLVGGMGAPAMQGLGVAPIGYGVQGGGSGYVAQGGSAGGYGQPDLQGAYANPQMGQGGVRPNQGGAPYMGQGY